MNQVHKVIWSRVKNCYIVVSEITKRVGRGNKASVTEIRPLRALLCAMVIAGCMLPADADAASGIVWGTGASAPGQDSVAVGTNAKAKKSHAVAQGTEAKADGVYALAFGYKVQTLANYAIAMGHQAKAGANAIGGVAIGSSSVVEGEHGVALGDQAESKNKQTIAVGLKSVSSGEQSISIGHQAKAIGNNSIAEGVGAKGYAKDGVAIGNNAESGTADNKDPRIPTIPSNNGVAVGNSAKASGGSSVSVGNDSIGNGPSSVAIGNAATANDVRTTAIGNNAHAEGAGSLSIGREASALTLENATSTNPLVTGTDEQLDRKGVMAIGDDAKASGNNSIALGTSAKAGDLEKTRNADSVTLTGSAKRITKLTTKRSVNNAVAIGTESSVQSDEDIAVGYRATTVASKYHQLPGSGQVAIGSNSNTYGSRGDVAIGSGAETNIRVKNVDHTNGPTEKRDAQSVAIGSVAKAYGSQAVAVGADTRAIGNSSVAIGTDDIELDRAKLQSLLPGLANNENLNNKAPSDATLGSAALHDKPYYVKTASIGTASVALGAMSQAAGDASMAMGLNALAEGDASTAIGPLARSKGKKSIAMGVNANSQVDGGVALGADSVSNRQQTSNAYIPSGADTAQVNAIKATKGTTGAVSVGSDTVKRQIINVAAGTNDSDAVNVDQLNAAIGGTAKATTVKAKDANVTVTKGTSAETGGREYTIGLGNVVTVGQTHPVTVNGDAGTVNGLTNTTWDIDNPQPVSGQAATEDQLKTVSDGVKTNKTDITNINTTIGKGLNFKGDDAAVINKKMGERLDIKGGADSSKLSDGNIGVVSGNGALNIKLAKNVKVDSVTTGNTVINNDGLTVGGKTYVTNNGLNANNQKVTNVADGQVAAGSKDAVNGGQLHDAKNEVINKGLRFDADNNSEKTNKLGSKVTVNGDNNITTEITQTGEDTKIGVKLNEDIHVKTVTATDTVKAGGVTMGSQTSGGTTGNYVTGLDNKTWNVTNPTAVSGRAATEDQLKTVTEAINNQSAAATDYRLVQNASSADGSYTVDTNGDIDLTVEDKNHAGQKETVKLKDIASKSKLDDVINKGLQFDANAGGTKTNKLGSKITVKGEGTAADTDYSGENLKTFITQDPAGNTTIDVKMNKNLKVETIVATGENGKDGKIGINGKDGQTTNISVTRDGKPGVDGAPGTTTTRIVYEKPDGTKEEVATLNDGMKYGGDTGNVIKKKLNEQVNVVGGITDENKLTTEDNLGVVSDGNNNLKVRLAKALKGLESITAGDTFINNNGITISNGAAGNTVSLTKNGLDNGGNKITNVAAGDVSANSTDAVNGSQLHDVKTLAGQHTTVKAKDSNITVTEGTNGTGGKEYTVGLGDKVTLGTDPSKQVSIDGTTGIIKAGDKVTIDGTTGNIDAGKVKINGKDGTVNGLTNKTWDPNNITSGQAATEDQLKAVDQKITNTSEELTKKGMDFAGNDGEFHRNLGDKVTIKGEGTKAASEYSGENIKTFADANGNLTVKMDKNLKTETIVATGKNGKDGKIGINGKDGVTTNISVTRDGKPGVDGAPGTTTTRIVYEKPDGTKEEVATLNDGMKYGGDTGNVIKKKLNEQVNVVGGITDTNKLTTEDNLGVVSDGNNNLKVRMAKDLKGLNSVTTNTLTVGDVKIDNSGINAGNKKITNVAAGDISANSTDAVNGGQLWKTNQTINNIGGAVNELGDRMDRVGAGAAALAALHPLDFDPDDKWDVAAGYGNYKDAHAVAVGAFYRPNEDTMFSVGGSFGGGENMVNAGVSVKLGQGNHVSTSRVALAKEVEDLKAIVKAQSAEIKAMRGAMQSGASVMKDVNFPDVPKDHWAYSYVKSLADRGLLEGYPDGEFKGDRSMTRYEFAAIIYRALQNGAPIDSDMAKAIGEFDPEINRIKDLDRTRVDRISGKDNDRHKVERVRVNNESNKEKGDYRDVYGSHISPEA